VDAPGGGGGEAIAPEGADEASVGAPEEAGVGAPGGEAVDAELPMIYFIEFLIHICNI
jgi:hypothetical protein